MTRFKAGNDSIQGGKIFFVGLKPIVSSLETRESSRNRNCRHISGFNARKQVVQRVKIEAAVFVERNSVWP